MSQPDGQGIRRRAAAALGIPSGDGGESARAAFLRRLPETGFAPDEESVAAANVLGGASLPISPYGIDAAEEAAAREVDALVADYWSMPPGNRRSAWAALREQAASYPRLTARLLRLESGLGVESRPHANPLVEEVAAAIRRFYLLPPRERAVRRAEWLAERVGPIGGEFKDLSDAARRLRTDDPALAALDPDLIRRLTECTAAAAVPVAAASEIAPDGAEIAAAQEGYSSFVLKHRPSESDSEAGSKLGCGGTVVIGWIMLALIRACVASSSQTSPTYPTPPPYSAPKQESLKVPLRVPFTQEEIQAFQEYERDEGLRRLLNEPPRTAPSGYTQWLRAGSPATPYGPPTRPVTRATRR